MMLVIAIHATAQQGPIRLMRYPDVANGKIVFCYQGDLWLVEQSGGRAMRLTVHHGDETSPKFSPDGKWIAFTGNYFGGRNVFIIPVGGGQPRQLTYHPIGSWVRGWTLDSKYVVFDSWGHTTFFVELFKVGIDGRYPEKLPVEGFDNFSFSPDGSKMVLNNHPGDYNQKRYRGSFNRDLWIYNFESKTFEQITRYDGNDNWPMWGKDDRIYFVSDRNGIANIFTYSLENKQIQQITEHTDDGVQWPSMSPDGKFIVYQNNGRLYLLDTVEKATEEVVVYAPTDDHFDLMEFVNPKEQLQDFDISPSGKRIVFDARGDIFTAPAERGDIRNLTESSGAREQHPVWSPDGTCIAYVSDASGEQEIYIINQMGKDEPVQITNNGKFKFGLRWSPDSKKLLYYTTSDHYLYMVDVESKQVSVVAQNDLYGLFLDSSAYGWSPDSKWIAYTIHQKTRNTDIYLYSVAESKSYEFISGPGHDYSPVFTRDGRTLVYFSKAARKPDAVPEAIPEDGEIHSVSLMPEEAEPYQEQEGEEEVFVEGQSNLEKGQEKAVEENAEVEIEFGNVLDRVRVVPVDQKSCSNLQVTDDHYYFLSSGALYAFNTRSVKVEKMMDKVSEYRIAAGGRRILTWDGEAFQVADAGIAGGGDMKPVNLDGLTMKVDRLLEWKQMFHEGWRWIRDYFYDENYHGVDLEGIRRRYAELLPYVRTRDELNTLMEEMMGELNVSHQSAWGGDRPLPVKWYRVAMLGARLEPDYEARYYRFIEIYKGDKSDEEYRSPLDADYVEVEAGDYLLAINGQPIPATENYLKYLVNQHPNHLTLTTNSVPSIEGAVETRIKPITDNDYEGDYCTTYMLLYKKWVDKNIRLVDESSGGKIGYIHLPAMGPSYLNVFRKYFEAYRHKAGIIIDVRDNGGGNIDADLIDILERRRYQSHRIRGSMPHERPFNIFEGKLVVLCNEYSVCNAEMFASAVKVRRLGTVIGKQTPGRVLGAMRRLRLIDGGTIRTPFIGVWEADGTQLEGRGVVPDIIVENSPEDDVMGRDPQLEKAISYLMEEIEKSPRDYDYPTPIEER